MRSRRHRARRQAQRAPASSCSAVEPAGLHRTAIRRGSPISMLMIAALAAPRRSIPVDARLKMILNMISIKGRDQMTESKVIALEHEPRANRLDGQRLCDAAPAAGGDPRAGLGDRRAWPTTGRGTLALILTVIVAPLAADLHRLRLLHAPAQPGGRDHPVRRLSRHRPHHRPALGAAVDERARKSRSAPTTSSPSRSRSTTCAATRSRWRRRSSGAWSTPRRRCSTSTTTRQFVRVQIEAAIRTIGSRYPYDDFEHRK